MSEARLRTQFTNHSFLRHFGLVQRLSSVQSPLLQPHAWILHAVALPGLLDMSQTQLPVCR